MQKIIRVTTVPISLGGLLEGQSRFMSQYFDVIGVSSDHQGDLEKVGKKEGIRVISVEMTRKITPIKDLKAVYELYKIFKRERPDIVHSHTPKAGTLSMLAAKLAGVPHRLHTIAGLPLLVATGSKRRLLDLVEKVTYKFATKIYPNSYGLSDIIIKNGYTSSKKLKVIGNGSSNGIDTSHFDPSGYSKQNNQALKKELGISEQDFVFVYVGRLVADKGIHELIASFKEIVKDNEQAKLLLVGTYEKDLDPLDKHVEEEIDTNPNIIMVGWQNDVRPFFAISNVLVFPSYREGFPNVVMQAGAMGLASIVTDINGCNEIIVEGINGLIVPVKDTKGLFERMKKVLNDAELLYKLSINARENIVKKYERQHVWKMILKEYHGLLKKPQELT